MAVRVNLKKQLCGVAVQKSWVITGRLTSHFYPFRLSSLDMKYQIWKLGVVFTDNVSVKCEVFWPQSVIADFIFCILVD